MLGLADADVISRMNDAMYHRGPDDRGVYIDPVNAAALGHRRLSIIDLSDAGHQPMPYQDGRLQIVFNGEIYNFCEIRSELEALGHRFKSRSDTEVLVAAYGQWGEECVEMLEGMFAFAILDRGQAAGDEAKLFLARDRLGIKPLYYSLVDGVFIFASEIKALLASRLITRKVDRQAVWHFLSLGAIPQPRTILADVKMVMPAHVMRYGARTGIVVRKYWDIAEDGRRRFPDASSLCKAEASEYLRQLLEQATKKHLTSDVPVGAFLSGGIDSATVVGLMSQESGEKLRTFSVGFDGKHGHLDELRWARIVADKYDTDHTEVMVSGGEVAECFSDIVKSIDQPSLDGTNTYLISRAAGKTVKVAISGVGGDELFAGYPHFARFSNAAAVDRRFRWLGASGKRRAFSACPRRFMPDKMLYLLNRAQRYETLRNLSVDAEKHRILSPSFMDDGHVQPLSEVYGPWLQETRDTVSELTYVEVQGYLVNTLLRDVDAMSMAHSLEIRPVLLDHRVAEFAFTLPPHLKMNSAVNKPALVRAVHDLLPNAVVNRKKSGFELPLREWLVGPLKDRAMTSYSSKMARSIFSRSFLDETLHAIRLRQKVSYRVWAYMILVEWLEMHHCEP